MGDLYPCPSCGQAVSRSAFTCPKCGRVLVTFGCFGNALALVGLLVVVAIVMVVASFFRGC